MVSAASAPNSPVSRPFWIPGSVKLDTLPPGLQVAIKDILEPAYQELVLEASSALDKSTGLTLVHLMWVELQEMMELGVGMSGRVPRGNCLDGYQRALDRHLRLVSTKDRYSKFLLQIKAFRAKFGPDA